MNIGHCYNILNAYNDKTRFAASPKKSTTDKQKDESPSFQFTSRQLQVPSFGNAKLGLNLNFMIL